MAATAVYRQRMLEVRTETYRDLLRIWPAFDPADPRAIQAWLVGASGITRRDRARFAALAQWYVRQHGDEAGVTIRPAQPAPLAPEQLSTSLRVTSIAAYAKAREAGKLPTEALRIAAVRSSGAASRLALNGGRSVIQQTAKAGRIAGYTRVGNPQCDLCKTLLGRFYPASTQDFKCHDHCACSLEPVYRA